MAQQRSPKRLSKFMAYILERRPDEFGLVTDSDGYIKVKELIKVLNEEADLKYVRRSHLDEVLITLPDPPFELSDNVIRAKQREHLPKRTYISDLPKLLYTCVRQKAYPYVKVKGIYPTGYAQVILSSRRDLAERMGRRIDRSPILLTVQVEHSKERGVAYYGAGESLFLADFIPPECFSGPPLPKEKPVAKKPDEPEKSEKQKMAGSYFIDFSKKLNAKIPASKREKNRIDWKSERKGMKKQKRKRERPPWKQ
jgi:putative RNA 2'-phosphotransferase